MAAGPLKKSGEDPSYRPTPAFTLRGVNYTRGIPQDRNAPEHSRQVIAARVDAGIAERLAAAAAAEGVTRSRWIAQTLDRALRPAVVDSHTAPRNAAAGPAVVSVEARTAA